MLLFSSLPLTWVIAIFVATAAAVWLTGTRLSYLADAISGRTGVGRAFMGLIFLAGITELPELVTTVYAAWKGSAALALNNMFGGIVMQTAILAVADAFVVHAVITA
ncbi:MAG: sodium:calcium antiporter, partial [Alphaproteobacteria bacterium]|nr:sodium:calcium antiporter [Alphaproteobacteria bacterium]